ncbi:MAG: type IV pili twitching motility protein PilT [Candidatus Levybacteria bacterium RIFCSPLOWO2_01_FULL_38_13]|nr:MAG: type IV pili twitching motility protein PilT [Candidatus Levybacteria bacterium RIFCSPHIGHO2_01_FULL_41_15]OGH35249.1 MAG: type IV pili twitching motility protein PilT [Candidatus Levybacteria bacterium RIFCSPLOWO2_01_FULL_38_13]
MDIQNLLHLTVTNKASDLHLVPGSPPAMRVDGSLNYLSNSPPLSKEEVETMIFSLINSFQKDKFLKEKELDFSFDFGGETQGNLGRFRANLYFQKRLMCAEFRFLEPRIRTIEELNLPKILHNFASLKQGFVLVTGPTGHGKSTTLAAIINEINLGRSVHILTIEDPVEYVYPKGRSLISQREMGLDTNSWEAALKAALREDPDVVLIGEMRDPETIASAMTIAETGHLVLSTLHTNSASQSIDRIIDVFPSNQQSQIKTQLSAVLKGIVSQRLLPQISGGRIPAVELMLGTPAVASNIREGKTYLIDSIIQNSQDIGMIPLESSLSSLVLSGAISLEIAKSYALRQDELLRLIGYM